MKSGRFVLCFAAILFAIAITSEPVAAATATNTTLALTSGGVAVTQVPALTVVTLTATVKAGGTAVQLGTVNFCDASAKSCSDIHLLGTAQLTKAGTAKVSFRPGAGSHSYKAVFLATKSNAASASSLVALTVTATAPTITGMQPTTTSIAQSGNEGDYALTAWVNGPIGIASPTGTVSFEDTSDGNSVLDTATLGTGTPGPGWSNSQNIFTYYSPQTTVAADLNGDGILDLASPGDASVTILLGNGDGTFTAKSSVENCYFADAIAVADFNGDGIPDMAVTCFAMDNTVNIYLGNGDGTFTLKSRPGTGNAPNDVKVADFNGDGILDLAVANAPWGAWNALTPYLTILLGNGDGTFTAAPNVPAPGEAWAVSVGDFNGDGIPDLAFSNNNIFNNSVSILLGNGDGTFAATASPATGNGDGGVLVGDFNGDGKLDLASSNKDNYTSLETLTLLLGNGDGTFTAAPESPITISYPGGPCIGDFNGDGVLDLAVLNDSAGTVRYLMGKGDGTFTTTVASPPLIGNLSGGCTAADLNGDGISDMLVHSYPVNQYTVAVWLTQLTQIATATASGISVVGGGIAKHQVEAVYSGDSNHQGSTSGTVGLNPVYFPSTTATHFLVSVPANVGANAPFIITVTALGADGGVTTVYSGMVSFTSSDGSAVLPAPSKLAGGTGAFAVTLKTEGNQTITATDTANSLTGTSGAIDVGAVPPGVYFAQDSVNFGLQAVGSPSGMQTLSFSISAGTTVGSIAVVTQGAENLDFNSAAGGTCTAKTYSSDTDCTVNVIFTPKAVGSRYGAVVFSDGSGNPLATGYLQGTGVGPQITFANSTSGIYLPSAQTDLGSGFSLPIGLAVDASGNVFVADTHNLVVKEIVAVNGSIPASPTIETLGPSFRFLDYSDTPFPWRVAVDGAGNIFVGCDTQYSGEVFEIVAAGGYTVVKNLHRFAGPAQVAVDGSGNVFVAEYVDNGGVYELLAAGGYTLVNQLASGFSLPTGVAVDGSGNVFVSDGGSGGEVKEIVAVNGSVPPSPTIRTLASGIAEVGGITVDASGNVFVSGDGLVKEIVAAGGYTTIRTLGSGFKTPSQAAVDGNGNVFVSDHDGNSVVKLDYVDPPSLSFPTTDVGSQSRQLVTVSNVGNADLTFPIPAAGENPKLAGPFALGAATTCPRLRTTSSAAGKLATAKSCVLAVDFLPTAADTTSGALTVMDNNVNASPAVTQTISMTGTVNVAPPFGRIEGALDLRTGSTTVAPSDSLRVSGWAMDPQDGAPLSKVQILIDGNVAGNATLGIARPVIATLYPRIPNNLDSGWTFTMPASGLSFGTHTIAAVAYNSLNLSTTLRSVNITVDATSTGPPIGLIERAYDLRTGLTTVAQSDSLRVSGWAMDPQDGAPVSKVQILIDGNVAGNASLGIARPVIATLFPYIPNNLDSGWTFTMPASGLTLGNHTITAVAYDSLSLSGTLSQYKTWTINVSP
jgi:hypothetical protein